MPSITELIVALREKTGAGMMDCKRAITDANGDFDKALELLRKKGLADAAKRSSRATKEGLVAGATASGGRAAALVEVNCETDFVARTDDFQKLAKELAEEAAAGRLDSPEQAGPRVQAAAAKLGENITLRRLSRLELNGPGLLALYIHPSGRKQGALLELSASSEAVAGSEAVSQLAKELLLQIVAMTPRWVKASDVPPEVLAAERDIYADQLRNQGKPEAAIPKIVEGKLQKLFFQQWCLLDQLGIRDNKTPVSRLVQESSEKAGGTVEVRRFVRYQVGAD